MFKNKNRKNSWLLLKEYGGERKRKERPIFPWLVFVPDWMR